MFQMYYVVKLKKFKNVWKLVKDGGIMFRMQNSNFFIFKKLHLKREKSYQNVKKTCYYF